MTESQLIFRPQIHFTPQQNWMNDPNGLVFLDGEYHLFYQHNPYEKKWGHMCWGHAVSGDLLHWKHLPVAIWEDTAAGYTIFSGSAVIDKQNTAGFGKEAMIAVFTAHHPEPEQWQDIHIAYSTDKGRTFQQYDQNPVINKGEAKFGDPKVFWYAQDRKWIMVNICHRPQGHIALYSSSDLKEWEYLNSFFADEEAPGIWECPDLFPLTVDGNPDLIKWVMKVNYTRHGEGPAATCYFVGDFNGKSYNKSQCIQQGLTSDDGKIYAEVSYNDDPEDRRILMGWLRELMHKDRPWTGAMAIPRELSLGIVDGRFFLHQEPISTMTSLRQEGFHIGECVLENGHQVDVDLDNNLIEAHMTVTVKYNQRVGFNLQLNSGKEAIFGYDAVMHKLFYILEDRVITSPITPVRLSDEYEEIALRLFLDQAYVELFGDTQSALTSILPYGESTQSLSLYSDHGPLSVRNLDVWKLASTLEM